MTGLKTTTEARRRFFEALYPRERWTPSEWAENERVLSPEESSEPGPFRWDRTPWWRPFIDKVIEPGVQEVDVLKGAQVAWSEFCRNFLGYCVDLDPGPCLILAADEKSANDFKVERLEPLIRNTAAVRRHLTDRARDETKNRIRFDTMSVYLAWAGSKTGTKSRPIRYLICEEPDEYPPFSSTGGDPLSKAMKRISTYADKGKARVLIGGTPTTRMGNVWKRWEMCPVRYHFWVPCPHCNRYQLLQWKQVRWPELKEEPDRAKRANRIEAEGLAYYECEHCHDVIRDHHKPRMLRRGVLASEDQAVTVDGRVVGPEVKSKRIGLKVSSLYSPWEKFGTLAREWVEAQGDTQTLADFVNQRLAEPFEEQRARTEPDFIREKVQQTNAAGQWEPAPGSPPPLLVPKWAKLLIATADTQGNSEADGYFWYVVRAWAHDYRSQLIDYGACSSFGELKERCLGRRFAVEGGNSVNPRLLLVDSGGPRWNEVYQFAQTDPRVYPAKGENYARDFMVVERPQKAHKIVLWKIDTEQSKDLLHRLIHDPDRTKWMPHHGITEDYCRQMCAESKIFDPNENRLRWVEIVKNNNHFWDCEHMQCAAAWRLGAGVAEKPQKPAAVTAENSIAPGEWLGGGKRW